LEHWEIKHFRGKMRKAGSAREFYTGERLSTVDLLIRVACFVKGDNISINPPREVLPKWNAQYG